MTKSLRGHLGGSTTSPDRDCPTGHGCVREDAQSGNVDPSEQPQLRDDTEACGKTKITFVSGSGTSCQQFRQSSE